MDSEEIVLTRHGTWLADGVEISHLPTRSLFARSVYRDHEGYYLQIGRETKRIQVEDTAYFIHRIDRLDPEGRRIQIWINDDSVEGLDPSTLAYQPGRLICRVKNGSEEARFLHSAYVDLLQSLQEDATSFYLEFNSKDKTKIRVVLSSK